MKIERAASFTVLLLVVALLPAIASPTRAHANTSITGTCISANCSISLTDTTTAYDWTVPSGVSLVSFNIKGGRGGLGNTGTGAGYGGALAGDFAVTAGQVITLYVGAQGGRGSSSSAVSGGRNSGGYSAASTYTGGGGGACTEIVRSGTTIALAAGGGGGGGWGGGVGGDGGGTTYTSGVASGRAGGAGQGGGGGAGTSSSGGSGGAGWFGGSSGTSGGSRIGGNGGGGTVASGGGGGCGYFGGGGGGGDNDNTGNDGGGGGGGSNFYNTSLVTNFASSVSSSNGNGTISLTYVTYSATLSLSLPGGTRQVSKGVAVTLTATTDQPGRITFTANGRRITGCIRKSVTAGTATCIWRPATHSAFIIRAVLTPNNAVISPVAASLPIAATQRDTRRS